MEEGRAEDKTKLVTGSKLCKIKKEMLDNKDYHYHLYNAYYLHNKTVLTPHENSTG